MKLTKKEQALINFIKEELREYRGSLILHDSYMAKYRGKDYSSGYFECPGVNKQIKLPRLHVAISRPKKEWLSTMLHEFCHFLQWKKQTKCWKQYRKDESIESSANLERECEKMTIALIRKQKFDDIIDITTYIKSANAYILFYQICAITDKWYEKAPFTFKEILDEVPDKLVTNPFKRRLSDELIGLYLRKCYKRKK